MSSQRPRGSRQQAAKCSHCPLAQSLKDLRRDMQSMAEAFLVNYNSAQAEMAGRNAKVMTEFMARWSLSCNELGKLERNVRGDDDVKPD